MPDTLPRPAFIGETAASALARASASIARLDQALGNHPLKPAFLYRARLDAVRRQSAVDGRLIDPWHLAALLEGLRLRMDHALHIIDRGAIFAAARHAFGLHQWLTQPDFDQEGEVQRAVAVLAQADGPTPLLAAAHGMQIWIGGGGGRAPVRAALIRNWMRQKILRAPVPLTGAAALRADTPWAEPAWLPIFLTAVADEAEDALQLLATMERAWFAARNAVAGRRRDSRAAAAIDIMAASPVVSASSLASGLGMAVKNAAALLDGFRAEGIAIEVSHRSKRRLYGLTALAPLRDEVVPPRRPEPGRGRGRPPLLIENAEPPVAPMPLPDRPLSPVERKVFDYSELDHWMAQADQAIRSARRVLDRAANGSAVGTVSAPRSISAGDDGLAFAGDTDHHRVRP